MATNEDDMLVDDDQGDHQSFPPKEVDLPDKTRECLAGKCLSALKPLMAKDRLPKTASKLVNVIRSCTIVSPYVSPLEALEVANLSVTPTPKISIKHAKKRVYVTLDKLKERKLAKTSAKSGIRHLAVGKLSPVHREAEKNIVDVCVAWIKSDPEGSEELLMDALLEKCEKRQFKIQPYIDYLHKYLTALDFHEHITSEIKNNIIVIEPQQLLRANNMNRIKHREVTNESGGSTIEFAIGVEPGENKIREVIELTPEGITGMEVSIRGKGPPPKRPNRTSTGHLDVDRRMRAVGQSKGLTMFFTKKLTSISRGRNAVLIPANEAEKKDIIEKVIEWLNKFNSSERSEIYSVPQLQQDLVSMCMGKVRRLTPITLINILKASGYVEINEEQVITYNITSDQDDVVSWQQKTVKEAAASCKRPDLLRKAFPKGKHATHLTSFSEYDIDNYLLPPILRKKIVKYMSKREPDLG